MRLLRWLEKMRATTVPAGLMDLVQEVERLRLENARLKREYAELWQATRKVEGAK